MSGGDIGRHRFRFFSGSALKFSVSWTDSYDRTRFLAAGPSGHEDGLLEIERHLGATVDKDVDRSKHTEGVDK